MLAARTALPFVPSFVSPRSPARSAGPLPRLEGRPLPSVTAVVRQDWERLFPGAVEGWDYFRACERAGAQSFASSAVAAFAGDRLVAAAPLFSTTYRLDMSLDGALRPVGQWFGRHFPKLMQVPIVGLGSPLTEECPLGFERGMSLVERNAALKALIQGLEEHARNVGAPIVALKDVTDRDAAWAHDALTRAGFIRVATLPVAVLPLPFKTTDEYLASLSANMRKGLRKKMRGMAQMRVEIRDSIEGLESEIVALFEETKAQRKADYDAFDEVPTAYFREVVANLKGRAKVVLIWIGDTLAAFSISLVEPDRVIGKYVGMHYPLAREHNLYFVNWMLTVELALKQGASTLQVGQSSYQQKVRLGAKLRRSWIYFKHRNPLVNGALGLLGPALAFDKMDPDLAALGSAAPYCD